MALGADSAAVTSTATTVYSSAVEKVKLNGGELFCSADADEDLLYRYLNHGDEPWHRVPIGESRYIVCPSGALDKLEVKGDGGNSIYSFLPWS